MIRLATEIATAAARVVRVRIAQTISASAHQRWVPPAGSLKIRHRVAHQDAFASVIGLDVDILDAHERLSNDHEADDDQHELVAR